MKFRRRLAGGVVVLDVMGKCGSEQNRAFIDAFDQLAAEGVTQVVLNLKLMKRCATEESNLLMNAWSEYRGRGGRLLICEANPGVLRMLEVHRMGDVFEVYPTETQALAAVHAD
jgi:stage II sporulation protein AA (anti-sigma F factor antagonist)